VAEVDGTNTPKVQDQDAKDGGVAGVPEHLRGLLDVALFEQKSAQSVPARHHPTPRLIVHQPRVKPAPYQASVRGKLHEKGTTYSRRSTPMAEKGEGYVEV